jgi:hypothetical protein
MVASGEGSAAPRALIVVFWAQVAAFVLLIVTVLIPDVLRNWFRPVFLPLMGLCFLLGLALLILAALWKRAGLLRTFWILGGSATTGVAVGSALHNLFYGLGTVTEQWPIVQMTMGGLEVAFFLIAVIACPLAFLVGTVGAIVALVRQGSAAAAP